MNEEDYKQIIEKFAPKKTVEIQDLKEKIVSIDERDYRAYKDLQGTYNFDSYILFIDHIQGEPGGELSRFRILTTHNVLGYDKSLVETQSRKVGLADYLTRSFYNAICEYKNEIKQLSATGEISIFNCNEKILPRSSIQITDDYFEIRFRLNFPAQGRTVVSKETISLIFDILPKIFNKALLASSQDINYVTKFVLSNEDQDYLRNSLQSLGLVSFIANGSILKPVDLAHTDKNKIFTSPKSLEVSIKTKNGETINGMGISEGITIIVGGGFHGKSTLIDAITEGVYNHIPGDGRECIVTRYDAVKIKSEKSRSVQNLDVSYFIDLPPNGINTKTFSTENADKYTSQAANIMEAIELGSRLLIIDEDESAPNFIFKDARMQRLIDNDPLIPFIDRVQNLWNTGKISTILSTSTTGDYLDSATCVIKMTDYASEDVTAIAKNVSKEIKSKREFNNNATLSYNSKRFLLVDETSKNMLFSKRTVKVNKPGILSLGKLELNLQSLDQLADNAQAQTIGEIIYFIFEHLLKENKPMNEILIQIVNQLQTQGLDSISIQKDFKSGELALPRIYEIGAAINRLNSIKIEQRKEIL